MSGTIFYLEPPAVCRNIDRRQKAAHGSPLSVPGDADLVRGRDTPKVSYDSKILKWHEIMRALSPTPPVVCSEAGRLKYIYRLLDCLSRIFRQVPEGPIRDTPSRSPK